MTVLRFVGGNIVVGADIWTGAEIEVADGRIAALRPIDGAAEGAVDLAGGWLMPGFVDTQVNGGGGVLFNDDTSVDGIAAIGAAHARFGTTAFMPTLISDALDRVALALEASDAAMAAGVPGVVGVHIEGPFLNQARKGIHDASRFRRLDDEAIGILTRPHRGVVMVTIAPELATTDQIAALVAGGVRVSAGHSEASYDQAKAAFDAGLSGITHLFNAMPGMRQRDPSLAGAALDDPRPWCGIICDGVHVDPAMIRIALACRPADRMMLVTDAMPAVGTDATHFLLQGRTIRVAEGMCVYDDGTLAGAQLDMAGAVACAVDRVGVAPARAAAMAATNPSAFLGLSHERGTIAAELRADFAQLDARFGAVATWIGGKRT